MSESGGGFGGSGDGQHSRGKAKPRFNERRLQRYMDFHEKGTSSHANPMMLIEKIVRGKIWDCTFWKEHCFGINAAGLVSKSARLAYVGGTYGPTRRPSPFICLAFKMLDIAPSMEVAFEFVRQQQFKYARALGAFYLRLTCDPVQVYGLLEPLLNDRRRLRIRLESGDFVLSHMDEFVDSLLHDDRVCDTILPTLPRRDALESKLGERRSRMRDKFNESLANPISTTTTTTSSSNDAGNTNDQGDNDHNNNNDNKRKSSGNDADDDGKKRKKRKKKKSGLFVKGLKAAPGSIRSSDYNDNDNDDNNPPATSSISNKTDKESLSIAETNALRASLGLAPLKP